MKPETIPMTMAIRALKAAKIDFELRTYDFTPHGGTVQCAKELGVDHHAVIKTIILEDDAKKPFVCLMHGDREISVKNLARVRGVKTVSACSPETADRHSGYHVGGTSPFGTRKRMKVYIESTIFDLPAIYINAGHRGICAVMTPSALETVLDDTERVAVSIEQSWGQTPRGVAVSGRFLVFFANYPFLRRGYPHWEWVGWQPDMKLPLQEQDRVPRKWAEKKWHDEKWHDDF